MGIITSGQDFESGDQVTSDKLMDIARNARFDDPCDNSTIRVNDDDGKLKVPGNGITANELRSSTDNDEDRSVTTDHIKDNAVTFAKIQDVAASSVIGNITSSTATPTDVSILDEDDMSSNSATSLATQQSIKAYVDTEVGTAVFKYSSSWFNDSGSGLVGGNSYTFTHGLGNTEVVVEIWMALNGSGDGARKVDVVISGESGTDFGASITSINDSTLTVQLLEQWAIWNSSGDSSAGNWGTTYTHIKVVVIG